MLSETSAFEPWVSKVNYLRKKAVVSQSVSPLIKLTVGLDSLLRSLKTKARVVHPNIELDPDAKGLDHSFRGVRTAFDDNNGFLMLPSMESTSRDSMVLGGRYKFIRLIGCGTFAQIVEAEDIYAASLSRKRVAIKITRSGMSKVGMQESNLHLSLKREKGFNSYNIVQPITAFTFQEHFCLAMELFPYSLSQLLRVARPFSVSTTRIRKLSWQLCIALAFLRSKGVIHADVRPENVLVHGTAKASEAEDLSNLRMKVKLADLGNSFFVNDRGLYYDDFELQTLSYRSPEVLFGLDFDCQIDMWSLGCLLVEVFMGRQLFNCYNRSSLVAIMVKTLGPLPSSFRSGKFAKQLENQVVWATNDISGAGDVHASRAKLHLKCKLAALLQCEEGLDGELLDFMAGLLTYDPAHRLTPTAALAHPFLSKLCPAALLFQEALAPDQASELKPQSRHGMVAPVRVAPSTDMSRSAGSIYTTPPTPEDTSFRSDAASVHINDCMQQSLFSTKLPGPPWDAEQGIVSNKASKRRDLLSTYHPGPQSTNMEDAHDTKEQTKEESGFEARRLSQEVRLSDSLVLQQSKESKSQLSMQVSACPAYGRQGGPAKAEASASEEDDSEDEDRSDSESEPTKVSGASVSDSDNRSEHPSDSDDASDSEESEGLPRACKSNVRCYRGMRRQRQAARTAYCEEHKQEGSQARESHNDEGQEAIAKRQHNAALCDDGDSAEVRTCQGAESNVRGQMMKRRWRVASDDDVCKGPVSSRHQSTSLREAAESREACDGGKHNTAKGVSQRRSCSSQSNGGSEASVSGSDAGTGNAAQGSSRGREHKEVSGKRGRKRVRDMREEHGRVGRPNSSRGGSESLRGASRRSSGLSGSHGSLGSVRKQGSMTGGKGCRERRPTTAWWCVDSSTK